MDSLKVLDPEGPIREADISSRLSDVCSAPGGARSIASIMRTSGSTAFCANHGI
jgi:hypothetical protein